jgi:hypothetical protein
VIARSTSSAIAILVCCASHAWSQTAPQPARAPDPSWSVSVAAYAYLVPDEGNYVQPTIAADHEDGFHVEARYNYEDRRTGSVWVGYTFGGGSTVEWEIRPIFGVVFGEVDGIAPGYQGSLSWKMLELYSEGEFVFDSAESSDSFFYNWSELSLAPVDWFRAGLVTQRTRAYQSERDIQRGLLVGTSYRNVDLTTYIFNPDDESPTVVVGVSVGW